MSVRPGWLLVLVATTLVPSIATAAKAEQGRDRPSAPMPCVEVRIGQDSAGRLDCLNREMQAEVDKTAPTIDGSAAAHQAPTQLGQPTPAEVKERLGNAYGHSLVPQRPPQTYAPILVPTR